MARTAEAEMTRMTVRLKVNTLNRLKALEAKRPSELKRYPSERIRMVVEDYVSKAK